MPNTAIKFAADVVDLSARYVWTTTVDGSPALAAETVIAHLTIPENLDVASVVRLEGWAAFTVGTSGVSGQLRIRQTSTSGTVVANSGALTMTAGDLYAPVILGLDASPGNGQYYVLTLQVASGAAASTVSAVGFGALVV